MFRNKLAALAVATLGLFGAGATVAAPAEAAALPPVAFVVCQGAGYAPICQSVYRSDQGAPDYWPGYFIELTSWQKANISSLKKGLSGNYVQIYEKTWAGTWGNICYSGYLPVKYVGDACNDDANNIRLMTR